jgi:tetratricopeptide (TPR) repeat protein
MNRLLIAMVLLAGCSENNGSAVAPSAAEPADTGSANPSALDEAAAQAALDEAEVCFTNGDYECSYLKFAVAASTDAMPLRAEALSRLAWAEYQTERADDAIGTLVRALEMLDPPTDDEQRALRNQVVYDLPTIFTSAGDPARAADLFQRVLRPEEVLPALEALSENYLAMGFDEKSRIVQESIRSLRPNP